jgi:hypothetical protein
MDDKRNLISDALRTLGKPGRQMARGQRNQIAAMEILQLLAGVDLYNQFVLQPFLGDCEALMNAGRHLAQEMSRIQSYSTVFRKRETDYSSTVVNNFAGSRNWHTSSYSFQRTVTVNVEVAYDFSNIKQPSREIALLDVLGFDQPISTVWELIPWSFLIDYFIKVGDFLQQFEGQLVDIPFFVVKSGWSCKTTTDCAVKTLVFAGSDLAGFRNGPAPEVMGHLSHTVYDRWPGPLDLLPTFVPPRITLPNLRQVGNIVDLVILGLRPNWASRG